MFETRGNFNSCLVLGFICGAFLPVPCFLNAPPKMKYTNFIPLNQNFFSFSPLSHVFLHLQSSLRVLALLSCIHDFLYLRVLAPFSLLESLCLFALLSLVSFYNSGSCTSISYVFVT